MLNETKYTISQMVNFFKKNYNINFNNIEGRIENILKTTSFKELQKNEKKHGFNEAPYIFSKKRITEYFFRKGTENQWEKELKSSQLKKIERAFGPTMKKLGYLK